MGGIALTRSSILKKNIDILGVSTILGSRNLIVLGFRELVLRKELDCSSPHGWMQLLNMHLLDPSYGG